MKTERVEVHLLPQIMIKGKRYRATNFRRNIKNKKWAEVDVWTDSGWRAVHDYYRIIMVAKLLWDQREQ